MSIQIIGPASKTSEKISEKLEQISLNSVRNILPDKVITEACRSVGHKYRERKLTPIVTVLHMILAAIWSEDSFNASWQIMWTALVSRFSQFSGKSPSRGKISQARARLPLELWHYLFRWISHKAQELSGRFDKWKGHRVVLLDGTCVSMSNNPDLLEEFGSPTGSEHKCRYPLARMVTMCMANTMTVLDYALGRYEHDENALARPLLKSLQKGDLLLADRHFAAAHFYWYYMSMGLEFLTRVHHKLKISNIRRLISYGEDDFIGWMKINEHYRKQDGTLPSGIAVRFIRTKVYARGRSRTFWFVTSLLDAELYPACQIAELYCRRWRIETLFRELKINLSADVLRSLSPGGIRKEVAARLIAVNIVRMIMLESAIDNNVDPMRISFAHAVRAIVMFAPALATEPIWKLPKIYKTMLQEIACNLVPCRPGRNEPRCVTRERKHYPKLKTTRDQWRKAYAA